MPDEIQDKDPWEYKYVDVFSGGIHAETRAEKLEDNELVDSINLYNLADVVYIDTGYTTFGSTVRGIPRASFQFYKTDGTSELLLVTNDTFYRWQSSEWQYVSDGAATTADAGEPTGETAISVADETGFSGGDYVGIILDDGTQHQTTVASTGVGVINIDDGIPAGRSVSIGAAVVKAADFSGSLDILVSLAVFAPNDWLVFTNGVDKPQRYDGSTCEDVPNLPSSGNTICRAVGVFNEYLLLMRTTEGGTAYPQRVRWCDTADPTNWTTGNAGYQDLVDSEDFIVTGAGLGPYYIIYKERSIQRMELVGTDELLFNFTPTVAGEGALSADSVVDLGDYHIFIGNANIYEYRAGFSYKALGDNIYDKVFGSRGELNSSYRQRAFAVYVEELDEVWFFYSSGSAEVPNYLLRYRQKDESWWPRQFADDMVGYGFYQRTSAKTWQELSGTWTEQAWQWNSTLVLANSPTTLLCGNSPAQVYEYDYSQSDDAGTDIPFLLETKDFHHPHYKIRVNLLEGLFKGTSASISYSTDRGGSWSTFATITPGANFSVQRMWKQLTVDRIRFKISGTGGGFGIGWLALEFSLESEW